MADANDRTTMPPNTMRRLLLLLLSPLWLVLAALSLLIGLSFFADNNPALLLATAFYEGTVEQEQMVALALRIAMLPFQFFFIGLVIGGTLWIFRHRHRFAGWVLGEPRVGGDRPVMLNPERRRTLQQIVASVIAVVAILLAAILILGQFILRTDLALVIAALTSSLAWGARLPIGDLLGGLSTLVEGNLAVGDRIEYRQFDRQVTGTVEKVELRYLSVRAQTGELTTIPFGELRIFRNYSRGEHIGVYAVFPIGAGDLVRAVSLLNDLAPESPALIPTLVAPWHPISLEGEIGAVVDLSVFGQCAQEDEDDLQLALHAVIRERFAAAGIQLCGADARERQTAPLNVTERDT